MTKVYSSAQEKPRYNQLSDWLAWLESCHPKAIDLGLSRIYEVACRLNLFLDVNDCPQYPCSGVLNIPNANIPNATVFTIAGTNGKGSCVATIEKCLLAQNYSVACYTSPHMNHYCERIHINGEPVSEDEVCLAFSEIDRAREEISLTYFEFGTLAALYLFVKHQVPYVVLEVGLGGRLDAANIVDADIAVVTSIAVDHEDWLGSDREVIALEKLGIARPHKPVVITETNLTCSLKSFIAEHSPVYCIADHFSVEPIDQDYFLYYSQEFKITSTETNTKNSLVRKLPLPSLPLNSVAAAMQALQVVGLLPDQLTLEGVLQSLSLVGRYQQQSIDSRHVIFDVAHNPAAAEVLAQRLSATSYPGKTLAVFAVMGDKDIEGIVQPLLECIDHWDIAEMSDIPRAADQQLILSHLASFGSFYTVSLVQKHIDQEHIVQKYIAQ